MGGSQTLNIALAQPERFAYIGVYSSGLLGVFQVGGRGGSGGAGGIGSGGVGDAQLRRC
jgi:hypothetical protein